MRRDISENSGRAAVIAALLTFLLALGFLHPNDSRADMKQEILTIKTATGTHTFSIEVAETPEQKARGLMFRRSLPDDRGMLFPYEPPQEATMWMKNTYISLDMIFIRKDGTVHRIETATEPFSEAVIASRGDVSAVLELRAGMAGKIGLKPGDHIRHRLFAAAD